MDIESDTAQRAYAARPPHLLAAGAATFSLRGDGDALRATAVNKHA